MCLRVLVRVCVNLSVSASNCGSVCVCDIAECECVHLSGCACERVFFGVSVWGVLCERLWGCVFLGVCM